MYNQYKWPNATKPNALPVTWNEAKGNYVTDINGKVYLDFTSSIFVMNCGHSAVADVVAKQAHTLIHSYTYPNPTTIKFVTKLLEFCPDFCEKVYLASAGSEVTSWALKLMRNYTNKDVIVHFAGAFHGKTGDAYKLENQSLTLPFPTYEKDWEEAKKILKKYEYDIGGIMIETYQGWSAKFLPRSYIHKLCRFAGNRDIPICFDEIQSGFYRTGKKFGYEWYNVTPDLMCLGKAIGGGMPLSALVGRDKYFTFEDMSSTHSGHPVCCAAGLEALNVYDKLGFNGSLSHWYYKACNALENGVAMLAGLFHEYIPEYNTKGMVSAIVFRDKIFADEVTKQAMGKGLLLVNTGKASVKMGPPVVITPELIIQGLTILEDSIKGAIECLELRISDTQG